MTPSLEMVKSISMAFAPPSSRADLKNEKNRELLSHAFSSCCCVSKTVKWKHVKEKNLAITYTCSQLFFLKMLPPTHKKKQKLFCATYLTPILCNRKYNYLQRVNSALLKVYAASSLPKSFSVCVYDILFQSN